MSTTTNNIIYEHEKIYLEYFNTEKGLHQTIFNPEWEGSAFNESIPFPNFQLAISGRPHGFNSALVTGYTDIPLEMKMEMHTKTDDKITFMYKHKENGLCVMIDIQLIPGTAVLRQFTTVVNEGNEPVTITHLSSMCMQGIATDGCRLWHDREKIRVHYCLQAWEGEGQWRNGSLEDLGLYPTSVHPCTNAIHFSSIGSWSSGRYLPMAVIEDIETSKVWYFQIETSSSWHFEIAHRGSWTDSKGSLFIHADAANERFGGWNKKLSPGESFTAAPVAVGCCKGDFHDAIKELTKYRRTALKLNAGMESMPVIFNDYMNCLWGNPDREKLIPLIDKAADIGAECFCMDAGWFTDMDKPWGYGLGDWEPSRNRFGDEGLSGILGYINAKGMIPGLWLEMEVCGEEALLAGKPDEWFLMRNGKRVGGRARLFLNYSNVQVQEYMNNVIDRLVEMGVGYIKNDYNDCIGNGDDTLGSSPSDGLICHIRAFYDFMDGVRKRHTDLILENCASGAMRQDYGMLSHFHIQSSTDQEIYYKYPSIIVGSLASLLPEQLGIWAYPYPLLFNDMNKADVFKDESYQDTMADGEQTIFNMVNGMCGLMYLSGHLHKADEHNMKLIVEGISLYKSERRHIHSSYPFWPIGFNRINERNSWASVGLSNNEGTRLLLAVWRLGSAEEYIDLPILKWNRNAANVRQIYPGKINEERFYFNKYGGRLTVYMPGMYQARLFEISI